MSRLGRMLRGLLTAGLLLAGACLWGCAGVPWNFDYTQAQRTAAQRGKPILLYFWDWLSVERSRMDSEIFPDGRVIAEMQHTVNVPLEHGWFAELARQYDASEVPTFIMLSPQGRVVARLMGVPTAEQFTSWLREARALALASEATGATGPAATRPGPQPAPIPTQPASSGPAARTRPANPPADPNPPF